MKENLDFLEKMKLMLLKFPKITKIRKFKLTVRAPKHMKIMMKNKRIKIKRVSLNFSLDIDLYCDINKIKSYLYFIIFNLSKSLLIISRLSGSILLLLLFPLIDLYFSTIIGLYFGVRLILYHLSEQD